MNYCVEEIESWLRSGEDSGWEFKKVEFAGDRPKPPTRGDWADEIAAFANAAGGAVLADHTFAPERQRIRRTDGMGKEI